LYKKDCNYKLVGAKIILESNEKYCEVFGVDIFFPSRASIKRNFRETFF